MAKRNAAGSSSGKRRGSSTTGSNKSSSSRSKSSRPFKGKDDQRNSGAKDDGRKAPNYTRKTSAAGDPTNRPFKKSDRRDSTKSSFSKNEERNSSSTDERRSYSGSGSASRPFSKSTRGESKKIYSAKGKNERIEPPLDVDRKSNARNKSSRFDRKDSSKSEKNTERPVRTRSSSKPSFKREGERSERNNKSFSTSSKMSTDRKDKKVDKSSDEASEKKRGGFSSPERREKSFSTRAYTKRPSKRELDDKSVSDPDKIRLNRYIANSGLCSRREADEFIIMGLVTVNGKVVTELGYKVNRKDEVRYEDKILRAEKPVYILMNKPKGYLTTTKDPQERNTVMQILGSAVKERVYPVGRLDRNTTGLLLLTNDGDLADKLMHPSYNVKKIYKVELDRTITKADFKKIQEGVHLEEGRAVVDDIAVISDDGKTVGVELHIGWNRVVRRIFESLQYDVVKLDRSLYAGLDKKDLPRGHWRFLTKEEVVLLKHYK